MRAAISQGLRLLVLVLAVPVLYLQDPHWFR
jgi:hypothetical protein